ncbi:hypothetical protein E3P99_01433 [Wallemia hederae]|uniref:Inhibitor of growth protein N-terminal histone-binding domain-containing protein n=1 Tax=Wallemia hederae TaxID=1540922 RepID=A0A4T0FQD9_9BASI|nr:hypothetical protein E3P99_01433 [Wallemia hederae]
MDLEIQQSSTPQPFKFNDVLQWPVDMIDEHAARLENSIRHLRRTNDELAAFIPKEQRSGDSAVEGSFESQTIGSRDAEIQAMEDDEQLRRLGNDSGDDSEMLLGVIKENEYTIASQQERVALLKYAKSIKLGEAAQPAQNPSTTTGLSI